MSTRCCISSRLYKLRDIKARLDGASNEEQTAQAACARRSHRLTTRPTAILVIAVYRTTVRALNNVENMLRRTRSSCPARQKTSADMSALLLHSSQEDVTVAHDA
jgi:hypothetical protein